MGDKEEDAPIADIASDREYRPGSTPKNHSWLGHSPKEGPARGREGADESHETAATADTVAIALPLLPLGRWFGFVAPSPLFFAYLAGATTAYLGLVEATKKIFYRFGIAR